MPSPDKAGGASDPPPEWFADLRALVATGRRRVRRRRFTLLALTLAASVILSEIVRALG